MSLLFVFAMCMLYLQGHAVVPYMVNTNTYSSEQLVENVTSSSGSITDSVFTSTEGSIDQQPYSSTEQTQNASVQMSSSSGLQDCYCSNCDPSLTVGKMFKGECLFISTESAFRVDFERHDVKQPSEMYQIMVLTSRADQKLLILIANELLLRNIDTSIKLAIYGKGHLTNSNRSQTRKCFHVFRRKTVDIDCDGRMYSLMVATFQNFITLPPYEPSPYQECSFNKNAVQMKDPNRCIVARSNTKQCLLVNLKDNRDVENIHHYLNQQLTQNAGFETILNDHIYKIDNVSANFNSYFLVHSRSTKNRNGCMFLDVLSKYIFYERCERPSKSLCEIVKVAYVKENDTGISTTSLVAFGIYGVVIVCLSVLIVLICVRRRRAMQIQASVGNRYENVSPIYRPTTESRRTAQQTV